MVSTALPSIPAHIWRTETHLGAFSQDLWKKPQESSRGQAPRYALYHFCITALFRSKFGLLLVLYFYGELAGIRTQDPRLKRALLYQLSYELVQRKTNCALDER